MSKKKKILLIVLAGVLAILLAVGIFLLVSLNTPVNEAFGTAKLTETLDETKKEDEPKKEEEEIIEPQEIKDEIVNILLLGVDADYKPYAKGGGDRHTDAIMIVAINMTKNKVDLISIPRDTFTYVPDVKGIYKMNAAINCGGGPEAEDGAGFEKTCESVSWMLGGISIDYYYALDFDAVVEIGDAIGGVDFNVDMNYQGQSGHVYKKGKQHLDGDGIMDYLRARKNATKDATDAGRVDRQKRMMVAIFKKLKESDKLSTIPRAIFAISDGLYTNATLDQTISLASFAKNIDSEKIGMYSFSGKLNIEPLDWAFCYTDQENRVNLIKQIYGVDVPEYTDTTFQYAKWLVNNNMMTAQKYINNATKTAEEMIKLAGGTGKMSESEKKDYENLVELADEMQTAFDKAGFTQSSADTQACKDLMSGIKTATEAAAKKYKTSKLDWKDVPKDSSWNEDKGFNEVTVNFQ